MIRRILLAMLAPTIAIVFAVTVAAIVLWIVDVNPLEAFGLMWDFASSSTSVASIINRAIPLYLSAIAVAIGFKMGLFNIGVEGQYLVGAMFAAWLGGNIALWGPLHITVIIVTAMLFGMLWAGDRGHPEDHPRSERGRLDDHAELHRFQRDRIHPRRGDHRWRHARAVDAATSGVGDDPRSQLDLHGARLQ